MQVRCLRSRVVEQCALPNTRRSLQGECCAGTLPDSRYQTVQFGAEVFPTDEHQRSISAVWSGSSAVQPAEALEDIGRSYEAADTEQDLDAWYRDIDLVTDRYTTEYRLYAERFTTTARRIAKSIPSLSADVYVESDIDPNSTLWSAGVTNNPNQVDSDPLAFQIWRFVHDAIALPNVDVWLGAGGASDGRASALRDDSPADVGY